ncbi:MAG: (d)CMP kinase [Sphaerochaetaceae bacterium]|nr:(d)CMP kinase [Sphaerochaetaceae bacterium]
MVIAIDGPAGVGKSSLAKIIAGKLGFYYLNSGNFYRAITLKVLRSNIDPNDASEVEKLASKAVFEIINGRFFLDGNDVEDSLHTPEIDLNASKISVNPEVRKIVNERIFELTGKLDIIAEGRDMTTVVFPDADYKFFFDARPEIRAQRRFAQNPDAMPYEKVLAEINERDKIDKNKPVGGLKIAKDSLYIDTSDLTINQVCEKVLNTLNGNTSSIGKSKDQEKKMSEEKELENKDAQMQSIMQEEYLKSLDGIEDGQLVTGTVVQVNNEYVFVDVGYKSEGRIPLEEFEDIPSAGDSVVVLIVSKEGKGGQLILSKKRADLRARGEELRQAAEEKTPVLGKFVKVIKGGFEVDLGSDYSGFCPLSKADVYRTENPEALIGLSDYFIVEKFHGGNKLKSVVSRRGYLEKKIKENKEKFFSTVKIGDVVEGVVKSFTSFGAFIDLGGFDGLLHLKDMSWGHVNRPRDFVKKGEKVQLRLKEINSETKKINLSLRDMQENPWNTFEQKFKVGDVITAPVTKMTSFGVFIEIAPGIEGLAHISELSWTKRITDPKEILNVGDVVQCKILGYDLGESRVSLGIKQLKDNPWDSISDRYPIGTVLSRPVVKITNSGAFVNLEEGIDGFLHVDDVSWTKKIKNMSSFCKEGDTIDVTVTRVEPEHRRIRLGVKQMGDNPWQSLKSGYPRYSVITGTVSNVTDFGVFVKVDGDIEGLISKFNLVGPDEEYSDAVLKRYKEGDSVTAMVIDVDPKNQKLSLSIKEMIKRNQESEVERYMSNSDSDDVVTIADLIKEK